jgi:hypothetical protein
MPGYDRSGPMVAGPRTGGGSGYCGRNANAAAARDLGVGGGFGRGRRNASFYGGGLGRGRRSRLRSRIPYLEDFPRWSPDQERAYYTDRIADLKAELAAMENHIAAMDDNQDDETRD